MEERDRGVQPLDDVATGCTLAFVPTGKLFRAPRKQQGASRE
jgi:hypothetical protein